jgi:hypothetical protein
MNPIIREDMKEILESGIIDFERLRGKTVLITGAYGMLASYLVFMMIYFNEQSGEEDRIQIIALGRNRDKMKARFDRYIERDYFRFLQRDVTGKIEVDGPVDFIIHAASHASPKHYGTNPVGVMGPNLLGTIRTLELAREKKSQGYLFSAAVRSTALVRILWSGNTISVPMIRRTFGAATARAREPERRCAFPTPTSTVCRPK